MRKQKGFTLIELLIVVAIIGIIAAIAIPSLLRARVSANESATIGDIRTVISGQAAYMSANSGWYDEITCLNFLPGASCIPNYPPAGPTFLDRAIASAPNSKSGYSRSFVSVAPGVPVVSPPASASSRSAYVYLSSPVTGGQTGVRSFGGDSSGVLCVVNSGGPVTLQGAGAAIDFAAAGGCAVLN